MKTAVIVLSSVAGVLLSAALRPVPARAQCPVADVGAAVAQACPCSGRNTPSGVVMPWKNHGQYQSCVVRQRNLLRKQGCPMADIASCSAQSTCGKPAAVLCCKVAGTGSCSGATSTGPGTCSNDTTHACNTDADCTVLSKPRIRKDAASCTSVGGWFVSGTGSVCGGCTPPVACCVPSSPPGQPSTCEVLTAADCAARNGTSPSGSVPSCASTTCP